MTMAGRLALTEVPRELKLLFGTEPPGYARIHKSILDAKVPAQRVNGMWTVLRSDLPLIAEIFGMVVAEPIDPDASPTPRSRRTRVAA